MARYQHGCTPSERHPGFCAECGEPLLPMLPINERSESMSYNFGPIVLEVPEPEEGQTNPGNIEPGQYHLQELVELLRTHKNDPEAIQFIADMMEE